MTEKGLHSYSDIFNLGHPATKGMFDGAVQVEEKIDGSQISFGVVEGDLRVRSKGARVLMSGVMLESGKMFNKAVETVKGLDLKEGWVYRGEYLAKPKHNVIEYARVPKGHIAVFDVEVGLYDFLPAEARFAEAERLGLEAVPVYHYGTLESPVDTIKERWMGKESFLGGAAIEGVVVKRYDRYGPDKKVLMAKFVDAKFKENLEKSWRRDNPTKKDVLRGLIEKYRTETRWQKAVQHGKENGVLVGEMKDLAYLMREVPADILKEEREQIRDAFFEWAWPDIKRAVVRGLPDWYAEKLAREGT